MKMKNLCLCKSILIYCFLLNLVSLTLFFASYSHALNTITQGQVLRDGDTLISNGGSFEFGFFSLPNSSLRYVGIWYTNISVDSIVWVANRISPISSQNGSITLENDGNLTVSDESGSIIWSSNTTVISNNYTALLHDDGNLEIRGSNVLPVSFTCWESFNHPTDTYLPGMRVPVNPNSGEDQKIFTSWKSINDLSIGNYSMGVDPRTAPQFVVWEGMNRHWRSGYWNGLIFTGVSTMSAFYNYGFKLSNADSSGTMYFTYSPQNRANKFKFRVTWDGYEKSLIFADGGEEWGLIQEEPATDCDVFNKCGANGYCDTTVNPICGCFKGFLPKYPDQWRNGNWSGGCVREIPVQCDNNNNSLMGEDDFLEVDHVKLPDFADLLGVEEEECEKQCLQNCSCMAYTYVTGIGCMTWSGELTDIQQFTEAAGNTLNIRVASSVLEGNKGKLSGPKIAAIVISAVVLLGIILLCLWKLGGKVTGSLSKRGNDAMRMELRKGQGYSTDVSGSQEMIGEGDLENAKDVPLFNYNLVASATNFFSMENKLGQGGFGPVYKGTLPGGQEIAVKKLSRKSGQGMEEFKNEIMLIATLQHRNLVRILGFCVHGEEKMLLYEYMPNKSLDGFIFDPIRKEQLDWKKRFTIIEGIARGLLYLHRDARCTIIHRDLKASNILLDKKMNPKISDFGMARIFGGDQDQDSTNRVVGTYGYMSPEYAMEGFFSERSDVFSFGVLLLEVITGQRTTRFRLSQHMNLVEYAWKLWSEGRAMELVDPSIGSSYPTNEVTRCLHIALLCVQDSAVYRPTMSQVVLWLETDSLALSNPKEPTLAYSSARAFVDIDFQNNGQGVESSNNVTVTMLVGR
ncbi:G-type lectin S-receptor-like serine/threonine-protein kinase B120 [Beta vulgaris subsp. vulgaris]|uniref:G-type lectin S-receptor-like serine/threonine-protein kinase B120 n=1 Tax=Beta vulgaris subsp. vulgaris TaxID=3555 RepID=UPI0020371C3B|nr:G-type lectin S-receptor-like serine/threonine-protein kinase B120 [Beta vulgaris subsp. vulgaris]